MANPDQVALFHKVDAWNRWRDEDDRSVDLTYADLRGTFASKIDLHKAALLYARLSEADLRQANLREADLYSADMSRTDLRGATLFGANLTRANLTETKLAGADFRNATLRAVNFSGADLNGADFTGATLGWTIFVDNDLRNVKGLDATNHNGRSGIDVDTFYKSEGKLPDAFLRGVGIPDTFIDYVRSVVWKGIEFYSCFISYSTKDQDFADRLYADLQVRGVRCWFAPHHIAPGRKLHEQIDEAIRLHERLLLILSPASMESEWVKTEIAKARKREVREQRRVLFPVGLVDFTSLRVWECFDADTGKDSAREIREYFIPDFSRWKHDPDAYKREFNRLVDALKTEAQKT